MERPESERDCRATVGRTRERAAHRRPLRSCVFVTTAVARSRRSYGPLYTGPVRVIGDDDYGRDADGDGIGCEDS